MRLKYVPLQFAAILLIAACSAGPDYERPSANVPVTYKELPQGWKLAHPKDEGVAGDWWKVYNDPILNALEGQIEISNENLKAAEAAYRAAQALVSEDRASFFPTISVNAGVARGKASAQTKEKTTFSTQAGATWDVDVWGRIRRQVEGDEANAQASAADLAAAKLSAQAELASNYFSLRAQDDLKKLLDETAKGQKRSLKIAEDQYRAGLVAKSDVISARQLLEQTRAQAIATGIKRAQVDHAIAALLGKTPDQVSIVPATFATQVPSIPVSVPSALLERRPDIAAAERRMAAANAQIGFETAAYFPTLPLTASYGTASPTLGKLFSASNALWSIGATLAETVFDAGSRGAKIEAAEAGYDQKVALYRQTVLTSFQQIEDQLAALRILSQQEEAQKAVVNSAREAERLVLNQYRAGIVPFTSVIVAQTTRLSNEQAALSIRQDRLLASVSLIKALGGGWSAKAEPK
ncbi:MAG: efflux transporter outer membrane subunit [Alphaproteobacteria bacterium]|nr:efflux transporter outer membrane subunit [Alphaproteobacteria bacterium]